MSIVPHRSRPPGRLTDAAAARRAWRPRSRRPPPDHAEPQAPGRLPLVQVVLDEGHWRELAGADRFDVMCQTMQTLLDRLTGH
jgi:hypothetical protein